MRDINEIPKGMYCYKMVHSNVKTGKMMIKLCPYWSKNQNKEAQNNGHCSYLGRGDWESNSMSLLWDMVKECGINMDFDEEFLERYL